MPSGWQWAILLIPAACCGLGVLVAIVAHRHRCELLQDRAWDDGYREGHDRAQAFSGTMVADYPQVVIHSPRPQHHARPRPSADASRADAAVLIVRAQFDRIRAAFGIPDPGPPAAPSEAELAHWADVLGPPSGELLRASGIDVGPPWPRADRPV